MSTLDLIALVAWLLLAGFVWVMLLRARLELERCSERTPVRRRVVVRVRKEMTRAECVRALSSMGDEHPAWLAVNQVLADAVENAMAQVSNPALAMEHGAMAHTAGGIEWLRAVQVTLHELKAGKEEETATTAASNRRAAVRAAMEERESVME